MSGLAGRKTPDWRSTDWRGEKHQFAGAPRIGGEKNASKMFKITADILTRAARESVQRHKRLALGGVQRPLARPTSVARPMPGSSTAAWEGIRGERLAWARGET